MKSYLKEDFKRAIISRNTLIAIILCFICISLNFTDTNFGFYVNNKNVVTGFLLIYKGQFCILFYFFASLIAALPHSASYSIDLKSGFIKSLWTRIGKKRYFILKFIVTGFVGGTILSFCLIMTLGILFIIFRNNPILPPSGQYIRTGAFSFYYNNNPLGYVFICILINFGYGFIFSTFGLAVSVISENIYLSIILPLLFPVLTIIIIGGTKLALLTSPEILFYPMRFASSTITQFFTVEVVWLVFVIAIYIVGIKRKVANE